MKDGQLELKKHWEVKTYKINKGDCPFPQPWLISNYSFSFYNIYFSFIFLLNGALYIYFNHVLKILSTSKSRIYWKLISDYFTTFKTNLHDDSALYFTCHIIYKLEKSNAIYMASSLVSFCWKYWILEKSEKW